MDDDRERDRLVQRVYARASADEPERAYTDPDTGEALRMRPSAWELMLYDRRRAAERQTVTDAAPAAEVAADGALPASASPVDDDASMDAAPRAGRGRKHLLAIGLAAGVLIGAVGVALVDGVASGGGSASSAPTEAPRAMLRAVFNTLAYPPASPGDGVVVGFLPNSFRKLAGDIVSQDDVQIYAAIRNDGAYCLVSVVQSVRAITECGTPAEIADRGLHMEKTATRAGDAELLTLTVDWQRDGMITWHLEPWPGSQTPVPTDLPLDTSTAG